MIVVRKFVHLLDQSDQDFQEELDLMKMREEVITLIRSNQQLENDLNLMDIKIGLLVKNKITLQVRPVPDQRGVSAAAWCVCSHIVCLRLTWHAYSQHRYLVLLQVLFLSS